jgi:prefoldin subunit 5
MDDLKETKKKMADYSTFIEKVLRPELNQARGSKLKVKTEIQEYIALRQNLKIRETDNPEQFETSVDLGYGTMFCRAVAKDLSKIYVHIGMGFHVEQTIPEALQAIAKRIAFLENDVLVEKERKMKEVTQHLESAQLIFEELGRELDSTEK